MTDGRRTRWGTTQERYCANVDCNGPMPKHHPELGPCWIWRGAPTSTGYAKMKDQGRTVVVHVWAFKAAGGVIPDGMELDHFACDRRNCVHPHHVRPTTRRENTLRSNAASSLALARSACINGHDWDQENTRYNRKGARVCKACAKETTRRWRERQRSNRGV